jgi:hypothetical protein
MTINGVIFDAVTDGKNVITAMLLVGLVFLATIAIGELVAWRGHRKHDRKYGTRSH